MIQVSISNKERGKMDYLISRQLAVHWEVGGGMERCVQEFNSCLCGEG